MESLALLAAVILLFTLVAGAISVVAAVRRPRHRAGRALTVVCGVVAIVAGLNLARLDIATGTRLFGVLVTVAGATAVVRSVQRPSVSGTDDEEHR